MAQAAKLQVEAVSIDRLFPNPANPRVNEPAVPHVAASIRRFGFQQPVVAKRTGELVAGHTRWKAAKSLGLTEVPVVWFDGSDLDATAYSIADNRTHEFATWDDEALVAILNQLRKEDALEGVEPRSNNAIAAGLSSFTPEKQTHHQALDLARNPGKAKGTTKKMRAKDRPLANDFLPADEFERILLAWFQNAARVLEAGRSFYIWGGYANLANYPGALKASGLYFSQAIIWNKLHPVLTRKDFMGAHEWCLYGWKEGAGHEFFGPTNATDLWEVKKVPHTSMVHLTEKPVELAARAIQYSSRPNENVLDLFGGSGSTLMGCEQTGRSGFAMEIDPLYCDVIVMRWEAFTGKKATLADGETFEQTKRARLGAAGE